MVPLVAIGVGVVLLLGALTLTWLGRRLERWGATDAEVALELASDAWFEPPRLARLRMTRAVSIDAPPEQVWPWLAQAGRGAGWYSYDRLDNGGRPSARHLVSWIPAPAPGDATPIGYLRQLEPGRELAWWLGGTSFLGAHVRNAMALRVTGDGARSRLVIRMQADACGVLGRSALWAYRIVDGFMARRQLIGIRERVERCGARGEDPERPETGARDQYQLYQTLYASGGEAGAAGRTDAAAARRVAVEDGVLGGDAP